MKAIYATAGAGIESLVVCDTDTPSPGVGEVLVRLEVATLNFRDLLVLRGLVPGVKTPPHMSPSRMALERFRPSARVSSG